MQILISPFEKLKLSPEICSTIEQRDFKIIVPIKNLVINENFTIGNVEFYQNFESIDDNLIKNSDNGRNNPTWNGNLPRARVTVNDVQFISAIMNGYDKISKAIDVIALRTNSSCQALKINGKLEHVEFDYYKLMSQVSIPYWVYCREINTRSYAVLNIEYLTDGILALEYKPEKYFSIFNHLFDKLLLRTELTQPEINLLQVMHWLRRAIQSKDKKDKLLDLWTAMEFLASGTKGGLLFEKSEIEKIKTLIHSQIPLSAAQESAIFSKLEMLNDAPLMEKFRIMSMEAGLELTENEQKLINLTRSKRNSLIHGKKDVLIYEEELNKLLSVIEAIFLEKVDRVAPLAEERARGRGC
jgi:hypothetical protein